MKKIILSVACFFLLTVTGSLSAKEKIIVCGTGDSQELLQAIAAAFEKANQGSEVEIPESIGSGGGIKATAAGKCDLGRVARPLSAKEDKLGLTYKNFARTPVVFAVHPSVQSVQNLTDEEIINIYTGTYTHWSQVGGPVKHKIYAINREEGDSSASVLNKEFPGYKNIKKFASKTIYSSPETISTLLKHKYTIGYGTLTMFKNTDMKVISLNKTTPSEENINNGTYKLFLNYGIVYKNEPQGLAGRFLKYLYSPEARKIMLDYGAMTVN